MTVADLTFDFLKGDEFVSASPVTFVVESIADPEEMLLLDDHITDLARRSGDKNILMEMPILVASWRSLFTSYQKPHVLLIWNIDEGSNRKRLDGFFPIVQNKSIFSLFLTATNFADPMRFLGTPLVSSDVAVDVCEVFLNELKKQLRFPYLYQFNLSYGRGVVRSALDAAALNTGWDIVPLTEYSRAALDAKTDGSQVISLALRKKKAKEYNRLRRRLDELGEVCFEVASSAESVAQSLDEFLELEAGGWKGRSGTSISSAPRWINYFNAFVPRLAERGQCEIARLTLDGEIIASGIILKSGNLAWYYKTAFNESYSAYSPGVLLTLDLTRYFCDHPEIDFADSCALADHPMIDHIWRQRVEIADLFLIPKSVFLHSIITKAAQLQLKLRESVKPYYHAMKKKIQL